MAKYWRKIDKIKAKNKHQLLCIMFHGLAK